MKNTKLIIIIIICATIAIVSLAALVISFAPHKHSFGNWSVFQNSSCSEFGIQRRFCACGEMQERSIKKTAHIKSDWIIDNQENIAKIVCTVCGETLQTDALESDAPNDNTSQKPDNDDNKPMPDDDIIDTHTHSFTDWETVLEASCSSEGLSRRACECGEYEEKPIPKLDHTYGEWETSVPSTCTSKGIAQRYCNCGEVEEKELELIQHVFGEWTTTVEPTCNSSGKLERFCSCGLSEEKSIAPTDHSFGEWETVQEPTCSHKGIKKRFCACGKAEEQEIASLPHKFGNWIVVSEASCGVSGLEERYCSCGKTEERKTAPLSHTEDAGTITGDEKRYYCIHCGTLIRSETIEISTELEIVDGVVKGMGNCEETNIEIPSSSDGMSVHSVGTKAFQNEKITSIILPDSIIYIEEKAFYKCAELEQISFGNGIKAIEAQAFSNCKALRTVALPNSLQTIDDRAFAHCTNLETVYLGSRVESIGFRSFEYCTNLQSIYFDGTIEEWNNIEKDDEWDYKMTQYTIHCEDGIIEK